MSQRFADVQVCRLFSLPSDLSPSTSGQASSVTVKRTVSVKAEHRLKKQGVKPCACMYCMSITVSCELTALVECVEPGNVIAAHLLSVAKGNIGIGDGEHGGLIVLGEGIPTIVQQDTEQLD